MRARYTYTYGLLDTESFDKLEPKIAKHKYAHNFSPLAALIAPAAVDLSKTDSPLTKLGLFTEIRV